MINRSQMRATAGLQKQVFTVPSYQLMREQVDRSGWHYAQANRLKNEEVQYA
jgi:hypothetical protein